MTLARSVVAAGALALTLALPLPTHASADPETKVKEKGGAKVVIDKSKPVRKAIEAWYELNKAAFEAKDVDAIMALRTDDFHTLTPDGRTNTRADMDARTRTLLERIESWISQDFEVGTIELDGDLASADVSQRTVRMQRFPDGGTHKVESAVVQRETWKQTPEGFRLYRVDNIRDGELLVDDAPYSGR
jgi:ketosteroid isomerase-like protein